MIQSASPVEANALTEDLLKNEDMSVLASADTLSDISDSTETPAGLITSPKMMRMDTGESVEIIGDVYDPPAMCLPAHD